MSGAGKRRVVEGRRDEVLQALVALLLAEGFARLTVDGMAARLQCSKSTLYAIASSKDALVATAFKQFFREAAAAVEVAVAGADEREPGRRIATYLRSVGTQMSRMSPACYADLVSNETTRGIYALNSAAAAERVRGFLEAGIASGSFRRVNARFVGESVALLIDGIQHGEFLVRSEMTSGEAFSALSDLVLAALTNTGPTSEPDQRLPG